MFFITKENECKKAAEEIIRNQFEIIECAICLNEINEKNKGFVYITCEGTADLERIMCLVCDKRFEKKDPYKRKIEYRFVYPFVNNEQAKTFLDKSNRFILNEGEPGKIEKFSKTLKNTSTGYTDLELQLTIF